MSIALEGLNDNSVSDRNFQQILAFLNTVATPSTDGHGISFQGIAIRFGTQTLTWPGGSPFTDTPSVTHGLGRTPKTVFATANVVTNVVEPYTLVPGATTFFLSGWCPNASPSAGSHETVSWLAIG